MDEEKDFSVPATDSTVLLPISNEEDFDERLRTLARLSKEVAEQEAFLKDIKTQYEELSYNLAMYMLNSGCSSKILDGIKFTQKQRVFSKVEDKELLRQWITEHDAVDLVMAVHPSKLTAYCNEQLEQGGEVPTGVNPLFIKYSVQVKQ